MTSAAYPCPNCGQPIPVASRYAASGQITCPACNQLHFRARGLPPSDVPQLRRDVSVPRGMSVSEHKKRLYIAYNWFSPVYLFSVLTTATYLFAMGYGIYVGWDLRSAQVLLFAGAALVCGLVYTYILLGQIFNNTHIVVSGTDVLVFTSPFPWLNSRREIVADEIEQLYVLEHVHETNKGGRYFKYDVVMLYDGEWVRLVSGLRRRELALAIEAEIEKFLDIPDEPVHGSVRP